MCWRHYLHNASNLIIVIYIVIRGIITVLSVALTGGIIKMTFPESRVFVLVNIYIFFVNNQHCQDASNLYVGDILAPGTLTQLKLKLKRLLHLFG